MGDEKCNAILIALENIGGLGPSFAYLTHLTSASSTQCVCVHKIERYFLALGQGVVSTDPNEDV